MVYTKAIVLSRTDFRILVGDIVDDWAADYVEDMTFRDFVEGVVDQLKEDNEVDEIVVFLGADKVFEIADGQDFLYVMEKMGYATEDDEVLKQWGYGKVGESRKRLRRVVKRMWE